MKPATRLTDQEIDHLLSLVRRHWPELDHDEPGVVNLALNRVQAIAEQEGVAAITPLRLQGLREIVEVHVLPFAESARLRDLIAAPPGGQGALVTATCPRLRTLGKNTALKILA